MCRIAGTLAILSLAALPLAAQTVSDRIAAAKVEAAKPEGQRYEQSLYSAISEAIRFCVPPGTTGTSTLGNFDFVANVTASGRVRDAAVQPATKVALCFREEFQAKQLPAPPYVLAAPSGASYPIVVEMKVTP